MGDEKTAVENMILWRFGGLGTDTTILTNTVQVPITIGTVTDSSSVYWFIRGDKLIYIQDR